MAGAVDEYLARLPKEQREALEGLRRTIRSAVPEAWPSPPPVTDNAFADCLGIVNDAREFALYLSPHVIANTIRVLVDPDGLGWDGEQAERYAALLVEMGEASGGAILAPATSVSDCPDFEDNRILELALAANAVLIVSNDRDLLDMSPWRGIPVITPREFASRVDAARRAERRRPD